MLVVVSVGTRTMAFGEIESKKINSYYVHRLLYGLLRVAYIQFNRFCLEITENVLIQPTYERSRTP